MRAIRKSLFPGGFGGLFGPPSLLFPKKIYLPACFVYLLSRLEYLPGRFAYLPA
jgi:hypothetical protein